MIPQIQQAVFQLQRRDITWIEDNNGDINPRLEIHHFKRIVKSHHIYFENSEGEEVKAEVTKVQRRDDATCMICFDDYEIGDVITFNKSIDCSHHFHGICIKKWLCTSLTEKCPVCTNDFED